MPEEARNLTKQKLAAGELVLCMNLRLARSVDIAMVAKAGGYDALYVDMQHAPLFDRHHRDDLRRRARHRHHAAGAGPQP